MSMRFSRLQTVLPVIALFAGAGLQAPESQADSAEVLPKGVSRVNIETNIYKNIDKRYDPDGKEESVAVDYNARLDSSIFPTLALVDAGFGLPTGTSSLGDSEVDISFDIEILNLYYEYGVTKKLSVGVKLPYWWVKTNVKSNVNTTDTTTGLNPYFGSGGDPFGGAPLVPTALGGVPLTSDQVRSLLSSGIDIDGNGTTDIPGFEYERFKTRRSNGFSDMEAGARYQYYNDEQWRLAFTSGLRLPTGNSDDPDDLVDYGTGDGTYDVLLRLNQDYMGLSNTVLSATLKLDIQLPDEQTKRVPLSVDIPIASPASKEQVDRDLGDIYGVELSGAHNFGGGPFGIYMSYEYYKKEKDDIDGDRGLAYKSLEDETNWHEEIYKVGVTYSTIAMYRAGEFPLPLEANVLYRNRFDGSNNILKSEYYQLGIKVYF